MAAAARAPKTLAINPDSIHEIEDHNPRSAIDKGALDQLADSIRQHGLLQPILVKQTSTGEYQLIAGHRRLAAARIAGLDSVPASVLDGNADLDLDIAITENLQRENLNPCDEAHAFDRMLKSNKLTQKALAQRLNISQQLIRERLRLLRLPIELQDLIAEGQLPLSTTKPLARIAIVSPSLATTIGQLIAESVCVAEQLDSDPGCLIEEAVERGQFALHARTWGSHRWDTLGIPDDIVDPELASRIAATDPTFGFRVTTEDIDAARSWGCLLEFDTVQYRCAYICDPAFVQDRVRLAFEAQEREVAEQKPSGQHRPPETLQHSGANPPTAMTQSERLAVRSTNLELGHKLARGLAAPKLTREIARTLAFLVLNAHPQAAARGVRLTAEAWQETETRTLKNGSTKTKVIYLEPSEAQERAVEWVIRPRKADEIVGRLLQVLASAHHANQDALPQSMRTHWSIPQPFDGGALAEVTTTIEKLASKHVPESMKRESAEEARA